MRTLPGLVNKDNKYVIGSAMFFVAALMYLTSNHFNILEPRLLPLTWVDRITPFLPYSVWIYVTEYFLFASVYILCQDMENLNKYIYSFLGLQTFSVLVFWIWPTTYPRDAFPLPSDLDPITRLLFQTLRQADTPSNCCPSLHVSSCYLSSMVFLDEQREKFPYFFVWATAVAMSTLTTKQHYLVDVVVGLALSLIFYAIFHRSIQYRVLAPSGAHANR